MLHFLGAIGDRGVARGVGVAVGNAGRIPVDGAIGPNGSFVGVGLGSGVRVCVAVGVGVGVRGGSKTVKAMENSGIR